MIKVYLLGFDGMTQHYQGYLPIETIEERAILKRDGLFYVYDTVHSDCVYYKQAEQPYEVTEW